MTAFARRQYQTRGFPSTHISLTLTTGEVTQEITAMRYPLDPTAATAAGRAFSPQSGAAATAATGWCDGSKTNCEKVVQRAAGGWGNDPDSGAKGRPVRGKGRPPRWSGEMATWLTLHEETATRAPPP